MRRLPGESHCTKGYLDMVTRRSALTAFFPVVVVTVLSVATPGFSQAPEQPAGAKTWIGHATEIEDYLKSAEVVSMKETSVGVTHPNHAELAPGGPVQSIAWKPLRPGRYEGYYESYKSEIAAYELDKLLGLGMVPPTVEKRVKGDLGAAVMWVTPAQTFKQLGGVPGQKGVAGPPAAHIAYWMHELTRAKMFDDLIGNIDPNLGNWLVDSEWNIVLIDHSRAFTDTKQLYHQLQFFDNDLWEKMKTLDEATLSGALGTTVGKVENKAILELRDKMGQVIEKLKAGGGS
jgi:hypothetical protein